MRNANRPHYVYRLFDDAGQVLYIGCTANPKTRIRQHVQGLIPQGHYREIRATVGYWEVSDPYPTWADAHVVEIKAIAAEVPRFNVVHNSGRGAVA